MMKKVSIIIPTFNEEKVIVRLLKSLKNQSYPNIEIIVVDDGSTDTTISLSKKYSDKVFKRKHAERSVQRNFGAEKSSGEYLLFLDADMELEREVVKECVKGFDKKPNLGGVVIPEESKYTNYWEKVKAYERSFYNKEGDEIVDAARFFKRSIFRKLGGYDEELTGPEDWDLPERIKREGFYIGRIRAKIFHYERIKGLFSLVRKKYYYGLKSYKYLTKNQISPVSPKTVYFLRPVFYKDWRKLVFHPILALSMFIMLLFELMGGGLGFLVGIFRK